MYLMRFLTFLSGFLWRIIFSYTNPESIDFRRAPSFEYAQLNDQNFTINKNFNVAVADPPLIGKNVETFFLMNQVTPYSLLRNFPEAGSSMKQVLFNEKSNYHSRIRGTNPHCAPGKWRTGPAFYRI